MIPALLETIGALSLLASVAAKIALLYAMRDEDVPGPPKPASIKRVRTACFRFNGRGETHRARLPLSARCVRLAAGRAAFSRTRRPG
ncbi:hypothetical protein AWB82_02541 [Caballeronia glebae]|uniref:Uncharacterized protein n=1 Tax=Caballeronia glebae TaxID=1777143 RepID=A0A158AL42_9BURK|nr:hypothetical protein AWB82_02541 [Caballeronia glebae]